MWQAVSKYGILWALSSSHFMAFLVHFGVIVCCNIEFQGMVKSFHILKATCYVQFFLKHRQLFIPHFKLVVKQIVTISLWTLCFGKHLIHFSLGLYFTSLDCRNCSQSTREIRRHLWRTSKKLALVPLLIFR